MADLTVCSTDELRLIHDSLKAFVVGVPRYDEMRLDLIAWLESELSEAGVEV